MHRTSEINYTSTTGADINELLTMLYQYKDHENNLRYIHKVDGNDDKTQVYDYDLLDQLEKEGETDFQIIYQTTEVRKGNVTSKYAGYVLQVTYNWYVPESLSLSECRVETLIVKKDSGSVLFRDYHDSFEKDPLSGMVIPIAAWQGSIRYTRSISLFGIPSTKLGKAVDVVVRLIGPDGRRHLLTCGPGVESVDYRSYRIGSYKFSSDENYLHNIGDTGIESAADLLLAFTNSVGDSSNIAAGESGQGQTGLNQERIFEYDESGNRTRVAEGFGEETSEVVYEIGSGNRVIKAGDVRFEYDDNGNMISRTNDVTGEFWVYIYDARNCMTEVQKGGATVARYVYDPEGNRIKVLYPQEGGPEEGGTNDGIYYHYDYTGLLTENPIVEEPVNGSKRNFIFLGRKLFARVDGDIGNGAKYWYMTDHLGTAHGLMDGNGTMVWWADYEAFGKAKGVGGPDSGAVDEVPRYTGKAFDERIGLYYFNARWYDPGLGRFVNEDPIRDGVNWHGYVSNNPIINIDPLGLREDPGWNGREDLPPQEKPKPSQCVIYSRGDYGNYENGYVASTNQGSIESNDDDVIVKDNTGNIIAVYNKEQMKKDFQALANKQQIGSPDAEDFEEVIKITYSAFFDATRDPSGVTLIGLRGWGVGTSCNGSASIKGETNTYDDMFVVMTADGDLGIFSRANFEGTTATGTYKSGTRKLTGKYPSIQDGIYELNAVSHSGYYALTLENDGPVPTKGENPAFPKRGVPGYGTGIHIHKGGSDWTWSVGCLTIYAPADDTSRWDRFINMFPKVDYGTRVGSLTLMTL